MPFKLTKAKKRKYNATYMGEPGSQKRRDYLDKVKARRGEPGSPERDAYNEYMRNLRRVENRK